MWSTAHRWSSIAIAILLVMAPAVSWADAAGDCKATGAICDHENGACKIGGKAGTCKTVVINEQIGGVVECDCEPKASNSGGAALTSVGLVAGGQIPIPQPGGTTTLSLSLDGANPNQRVELALGSDYGGGTVTPALLAANVTMRGTRRSGSASQLIDLSLVASDFLVGDLSIPGLGSTGDSHLAYTNLYGTIDLTTNVIDVQGEGFITNAQFGPTAPRPSIIFRTYQSGIIDFGAGYVGVGTVGEIGASTAVPASSRAGLIFLVAMLTAAGAGLVGTWWCSRGGNDGRAHP